jgi:formylglycine-generating enzyme required for sulfatase activity
MANYETPHILHDLPLDERDEAHFHFDQFAATLGRLIADKKTRTPLTIGISGAWGSGKTTLMKRTQSQLEQTKTLLDKAEPVNIPFANPNENPEKLFRVCRTVWFNAWKYDDEDELLVALVRRIVQSMADDDWVSKVIGKLLDPSYPRRDVVNTVLGWFKIKGAGVEAGLNTGEAKETPLAEKTAILDLFDEAFDRLMAAWVHHKLDADKIDPSKGVLVVFIDDLDRCLPGKTVQVLEAIKLFMDKPGCIFVLGADTEVIRQAVESYYQNAHITGQEAAYYLDKVIQLRFELPLVVAESMQTYLKTQDVGAEMLDQWQTLIAAGGINPRRVKAVVNDIELQWKMLVNSGQAADVKRQDFIRWSALLRAAPISFKKQLFDIDDPELRHKFIQDALLWAAGKGDGTLNRTFQTYAASRPLRGVLREIQAFSPEMDAKVLDAFIHLAAPPQKPVTLSVDSVEVITAVDLTIKEVSEALKKTKTWGGIEFVHVPAGKFIMGSKEDNPLAFDNERPQHVQELGEFWMGRYPVTNDQFSDFFQASGYKTMAENQGSGYAMNGKQWTNIKGADWQHPQGPKSNISGKENHPVVLVSWLDTMAYCEWLNQKYSSELPADWQFRLPTEAEWEKTARGEYGNEWPWGNEPPDPLDCNFNLNVGDTTPVGNYSPQGDSPYGCVDIAGNVWEWTHSLDHKYPYVISDGREDDEDLSWRVLRGGSYHSGQRSVRSASRGTNYPVHLGNLHGFRILVSPIHL